MIVSLITSGILLLSVYDLPLSTATMNCLQLCLNNSKIFSINSSYIATAKAGMQLMGVDVSNKCREPIVSLKPEEIDPLKAVLDRALN